MRLSGLPTSLPRPYTYLGKWDQVSPNDDVAWIHEYRVQVGKQLGLSLSLSLSLSCALKDGVSYVILSVRVFFVDNIMKLVTESVAKKFDCSAFVSFPDNGVKLVHQNLRNRGIKLSTDSATKVALPSFSFPFPSPPPNAKNAKNAHTRADGSTKKRPRGCGTGCELMYIFSFV